MAIAMSSAIAAFKLTLKVIDAFFRFAIFDGEQIQNVLFSG